MAIDKNPRQITRLRVEDQVKLEKLASVTRFDEGDNTPRFNELYVDGTVSANNLYAYETIDFTGSGTIKYNSNDAGFEFYNSETEFTAHLHQVAAAEEILTDQNVKTLFGNSLYGTGNIDLYRHQLKVKVGGNAVYFVITSSSNLKIASLQDLTTVTKATNGYFTLALRPGETNDPLLVTYNNNKWGSSIGAITEITEDVVQPL